MNFAEGMSYLEVQLLVAGIDNSTVGFLHK